MDAEKEITDLKKRMDYMEKIHPDITYDPRTILHGVASNMPIILITIGLSVLAARIVARNN